ncbi:unnamed protein product [Vitrella brassicaformis CCMP3155]|uniref:Uncharacterized protein n=3 Tax=Vitrella brassicaformis TaxID=1169539 RepID=A0A0G4G7A4_VITBC|nr:unnamed protein product [Vitrella brassicaformis CCMP3155]|eukprot:CEM24423.1 unnamed protein product [Vitrella brassicaformis CCMP3155]
MALVEAEAAALPAMRPNELQYVVHDFWRSTSTSQVLISPGVTTVGDFTFGLQVQRVDRSPAAHGLTSDGGGKGGRGDAAGRANASISICVEVIREQHTYGVDSWWFPSVRYEVSVINFKDPSRTIRRQAVWTFSAQSSVVGFSGVIDPSRTNKREGFLSEEGSLVIRLWAQPSLYQLGSPGRHLVGGEPPPPEQSIAQACGASSSSASAAAPPAPEPPIAHTCGNAIPVIDGGPMDTDYLAVLMETLLHVTAFRQQLLLQALSRRLTGRSCLLDTHMGRARVTTASMAAACGYRELGTDGVCAIVADEVLRKGGFDTGWGEAFTPAYNAVVEMRTAVDALRKGNCLSDGPSVPVEACRVVYPPGLYRRAVAAVNKCLLASIERLVRRCVQEGEKQEVGSERSDAATGDTRGPSSDDTSPPSKPVHEPHHPVVDLRAELWLAGCVVDLTAACHLSAIELQALQPFTNGGGIAPTPFLRYTQPPPPPAVPTGDNGGPSLLLSEDDVTGSIMLHPLRVGGIPRADIDKANKAGHPDDPIMASLLTPMTIAAGLRELQPALQALLRLAGAIREATTSSNTTTRRESEGCAEGSDAGESVRTSMELETTSSTPPNESTNNQQLSPKDGDYGLSLADLAMAFSDAWADRLGQHPLGSSGCGEALEELVDMVLQLLPSTRDRRSEIQRALRRVCKKQRAASETYGKGSKDTGTVTKVDLSALLASLGWTDLSAFCHAPAAAYRCLLQTTQGPLQRILPALLQIQLAPPPLELADTARPTPSPALAQQGSSSPATIAPIPIPSSTPSLFIEHAVDCPSSAGSIVQEILNRKTSNGRQPLTAAPPVLCLFPVFTNLTNYSWLQCDVEDRLDLSPWLVGDADTAPRHVRTATMTAAPVGVVTTTTHVPMTVAGGGEVALGGGGGGGKSSRRVPYLLHGLLLRHVVEGRTPAPKYYAFISYGMPSQVSGVRRWLRMYDGRLDAWEEVEPGCLQKWLVNRGFVVWGLIYAREDMLPSLSADLLYHPTITLATSALPPYASFPDITYAMFAPPPPSPPPAQTDDSPRSGNRPATTSTYTLSSSTAGGASRAAEDLTGRLTPKGGGSGTSFGSGLLSGAASAILGAALSKSAQQLAAVGDAGAKEARELASLEKGLKNEVTDILSANVKTLTKRERARMRRDAEARRKKIRDLKRADRMMALYPSEIQQLHQMEKINDFVFSLADEWDGDDNTQDLEAISTPTTTSTSTPDWKNKLIREIQKLTEIINLGTKAITDPLGAATDAVQLHGGVIKVRLVTEKNLKKDSSRGFFRFNELKASRTLEVRWGAAVERLMKGIEELFKIPQSRQLLFEMTQSNTDTDPIHIQYHLRYLPPSTSLQPPSTSLAQDSYGGSQPQLTILLLLHRPADLLPPPLSPDAGRTPKAIARWTTTGKSTPPSSNVELLVPRCLGEPVQPRKGAAGGKVGKGAPPVRATTQHTVTQHTITIKMGGVTSMQRSDSAWLGVGSAPAANEAAPPMAALFDSRTDRLLVIRYWGAPPHASPRFWTIGTLVVDVRRSLQHYEQWLRHRIAHDCGDVFDQSMLLIAFLEVAPRQMVALPMEACLAGPLSLTSSAFVAVQSAPRRRYLYGGVVPSSIRAVAAEGYECRLKDGREVWVPGQLAVTHGDRNSQFLNGDYRIAHPDMWPSYSEPSDLSSAYKYPLWHQCSRAKDLHTISFDPLTGCWQIRVERSDGGKGSMRVRASNGPDWGALPSPHLARRSWLLYDDASRASPACKYFRVYTKQAYIPPDTVTVARSAHSAEPANFLGDYALQPETFSGRPLYRQLHLGVGEIGSTRLYLFFEPCLGNWCLGKTPGDQLLYGTSGPDWLAFGPDRIQRPWMVVAPSGGWQCDPDLRVAIPSATTGPLLVAVSAPTSPYLAGQYRRLRKTHNSRPAYQMMKSVAITPLQPQPSSPSAAPAPAATHTPAAKDDCVGARRDRDREATSCPPSKEGRSASSRGSHENKTADTAPTAAPAPLPTDGSVVTFAIRPMAGPPACGLSVDSEQEEADEPTEMNSEKRKTAQEDDMADDTDSGSDSEWVSFPPPLPAIFLPDSDDSAAAESLRTGVGARILTLAMRRRKAKKAKKATSARTGTQQRSHDGSTYRRLTTRAEDLSRLYSLNVLPPCDDPGASGGRASTSVPFPYEEGRKSTHPPTVSGCDGSLGTRAAMERLSLMRSRHVKDAPASPRAVAASLTDASREEGGGAGERFLYFDSQSGYWLMSDTMGDCYYPDAETGRDWGAMSPDRVTMGWRVYKSDADAWEEAPSLKVVAIPTALEMYPQRLVVSGCPRDADAGPFVDLNGVYVLLPSLHNCRPRWQRIGHLPARKKRAGHVDLLTHNSNGDGPSAPRERASAPTTPRPSSSTAPRERHQALLHFRITGGLTWCLSVVTRSSEGGDIQQVADWVVPDNPDIRYTRSRFIRISAQRSDRPSTSISTAVTPGPAKAKHAKGTSRERTDRDKAATLPPSSTASGTHWCDLFKMRLPDPTTTTGSTVSAVPSFAGSLDDLPAPPTDHQLVFRGGGETPPAAPPMSSASDQSPLKVGRLVCEEGRRASETTEGLSLTVANLGTWTIDMEAPNPKRQKLAATTHRRPSEEGEPGLHRVARTAALSIAIPRAALVECHPDLINRTTTAGADGDGEHALLPIEVHLESSRRPDSRVWHTEAAGGVSGDGYGFAPGTYHQLCSQLLSGKVSPSPSAGGSTVLCQQGLEGKPDGFLPTDPPPFDPAPAKEREQYSAVCGECDGSSPAASSASASASSLSVGPEILQHAPEWMPHQLPGDRFFSRSSGLPRDAQDDDAAALCDAVRICGVSSRATREAVRRALVDALGGEGDVYVDGGPYVVDGLDRPRAAGGVLDQPAAALLPATAAETAALPDRGGASSSAHGAIYGRHTSGDEELPGSRLTSIEYDDEDGGCSNAWIRNVTAMEETDDVKHVMDVIICYREPCHAAALMTRLWAIIAGSSTNLPPTPGYLVLGAVDADQCHDASEASWLSQVHALRPYIAPGECVVMTIEHGSLLDSQDRYLGRSPSP